MKKILGASIVIAVSLASSSAHAASGPVVVWFTDQAADVSDKLAILCADHNASVVEQDDRHLLCQREVTGGKGILAQALLGNSSSTSPQLNIRFSIIRDGKAVRVQASQWIELQMAMGQTRRTDMNSGKGATQLEDALIAAGAHNYPPSLDPVSTAEPATSALTQ